LVPRGYRAKANRCRPGYPAEDCVVHRNASRYKRQAGRCQAMRTKEDYRMVVQCLLA
jgi:hypothetical protein